jgi:RNA polymerase sigma-70 factor (ECF subfamily)
METNKPIGQVGFPPTRWTKVYMASAPDHEDGLNALAELLQVYRPVLQQYLQHRYKNLPAEEIEDWISSFIEKKILEDDLLRAANKERGRFRNFLLTSLNRFAEDQRRHNARAKRQPAGGLVPYEEARDEFTCSANCHPNPGDLAWARKVIAQARDLTAAFYHRKARDQIWAVFFEACFQPLYLGLAAPPHEELVQRHGFRSPQEVSNAILTVKRHFGIVLREIVHQYEPSDTAVEEEIRELIAIVSDGS